MKHGHIKQRWEKAKLQNVKNRGNKNLMKKKKKSSVSTRNWNNVQCVMLEMFWLNNKSISLTENRKTR